MSNALEKKVDKILDYLTVNTRENNERFTAIDKRFDAIDDDMATLKGQVRSIDERLLVLEKTNAILQDADHNRQEVSSGQTPDQLQDIDAVMRGVRVLKRFQLEKAIAEAPAPRTRSGPPPGTVPENAAAARRKKPATPAAAIIALTTSSILVAALTACSPASHDHTPHREKRPMIEWTGIDPADWNVPEAKRVRREGDTTVFDAGP